MRRVAVAGAGPAGLYLAYLLKRRRPALEVAVFEQNPRHATFGFGVVFSDRALDFLREDDPDTHAAIVPRVERWRDLCVAHRGERVTIDGVGFAAIGRLELLGLLQGRALGVGVECRFETPLAAGDPRLDADLVVGADGVNSRVREADREGFGTRVAEGVNRFVWYGTTRAFATLTQTFRETEHGPFTAHHYRYEPAMSTFLVEVDARTWEAAGLARMSDAESRACCERVFAAELAGHRLISNKSVWRRFPRVRNRRWWSGNRVLLGDALHTAHFSIGSGTRLAMEDAIALAAALEAHDDRVPDALAAYEAARRPIVEKLVAAGEASMRWYERMGEHMRLDPHEFAFGYIGRSGRVREERLRRGSPRFVAALEAHRARPG